MTSGTNLFVRKQDVIYLDISSESALQYMLTAGAVMPRRLESDAEMQPDVSAEVAAELAKKKKG